MSSTLSGSQKRKSDARSTQRSKKARPSAGATATTAETVQAILTDLDNHPIPDGDDGIRQAFVELAQCARNLEETVESLRPKPKTAEEVTEAANKLRNAARSGIRKQMVWKPSCKTGKAKWTYDGVCNDPAVFGKMLGLGGPPDFKTKKFSKDEFDDLFGGLEASVRYDTLVLTLDVNVQWKANEGTFKFSGFMENDGHTTTSIKYAGTPRQP